MALVFIRLDDPPQFHGSAWAFPVSITTTGNDVQRDSAIIQSTTPFEEINEKIVAWALANGDHTAPSDTAILVGGFSYATGE